MKGSFHMLCNFTGATSTRENMIPFQPNEYFLPRDRNVKIDSDLSSKADGKIHRK